MAALLLAVHISFVKQFIVTLLEGLLKEKCIYHSVIDKNWFNNVNE